MTRERLWPAIWIGWALAAAVLVVASALDISTLRFGDPDDAMRLMEVRDWLGGQSWWDVSQHRLAAGAMHWSRLVDLPLALVILIFKSLVGEAIAERIALVVVPLATLFAMLALVAHLTRRLLDVERARLAVLIAPLSVPLLYQLRPMRIDHHGWQIVLALASLLLLTGKPNARNGLLNGLCLAALITVSLEGLPIAAALAGIAALAWAFDPARRPALLGTAWGLFLATLAFQLGTRGFGYAAPLCDAITPDWILVFGIAAAGTSAATLVGRAPLAVRVAALGTVAAACAAVLVATAPECLAGPFARLDPLTRALWYDKVSEGLPLWRQFPGWAAMTIGLPVTGLIGSWLALRDSAGEARVRWSIVLAALVPAFVLALLVNRAGATANAFAVPGAAYALAAMLTRARAIEPVFKRSLATAGALLAASPGLAAIALLGFPQTEATRSVQQRYEAIGRPACLDRIQARAVGRLPPALLFTPLDIAPDVLVATPHRAIASGHHRNMAAMHDVIAAFTGTPERAHALIAQYGAGYVVVCPGLNEPELYRIQNPDGFWARLERGERFDWLQPVPIAGSPVLAWRVLR